MLHFRNSTALNLSSVLTFFFALLFALPTYGDAKEQANHDLRYLQLDSLYSATETKSLIGGDNYLVSTTLKGKLDSSESEAYFYQPKNGNAIALVKTSGFMSNNTIFRDTLFIYSKSNIDLQISELPKDLQRVLASYKNNSENVLTVRNGMNLYALINIDRFSSEVYTTMGVDAEWVKSTMVQGLYRFYDGLSNPSFQLEVEIANASPKFEGLGKWFKPRFDGMKLGVDCSIPIDRTFDPRATNCYSLYVQTLADVTIDGTNVLMDAQVGASTKPDSGGVMKQVKAMLKKADKQEEAGTAVQNPTAYSYLNIKSQTDVKIGALSIRGMMIGYEAPFVPGKDGVPHVTLAGEVDVGGSDMLLGTSFPPGLPTPFLTAAYYGAITKLGLDQVVKFGLFSAQGLAQLKTGERLKELDDAYKAVDESPLKDFNINDVAFSYVPPTEGGAEMSMTFEGSTTLFDHDLGMVNFQINNTGIYAHSAVTPFTIPAPGDVSLVDLKSFTFTFFAPTTKKDWSLAKKVGTTIGSNVLLFMFDGDISIWGVEEAFKFVFSPVVGGEVRLALGLTKDINFDVGCSFTWSDVMARITGREGGSGNMSCHADAEANTEALVGQLKHVLADDIKKNLSFGARGEAELQQALTDATSLSTSKLTDYKSIRGKVQKEVDKITKPIQNAEAKVEHWKKDLSHANSKIKHWKHEYHKAKWFEVDKQAHAAWEVAKYESEHTGFKAGLEAAETVLHAVERSIDFIPVDADPRVLLALTEYRAAEFKQVIAKAALDAERDANKFVKSLADLVLKLESPVSFDDFGFSGSAGSENALGGVITVTGRSFGRPFSFDAPVKLTTSKHIEEFAEKNWQAMVDQLEDLAKTSVHGARNQDKFHTGNYVSAPAGVQLDYAWTNTEHMIKVPLPDGVELTDIGVAGSLSNNSLRAVAVANDHTVWEYRDKEWRQTPIKATRADINGDGVIWAVSFWEDSKDAKVHHRDQNGDWRTLSYPDDAEVQDGFYGDIAVGSEGHVWLTSSSQRIYRYTGSDWQQTNGHGKWVALNSGNTPLIVNRLKEIFWSSNQGQSWHKNSGGATDIAENKHRIWVVGGDGESLWVQENNHWQRRESGYTAVSADDEGAAWAVTIRGGLAHSSILNETAHDITSAAGVMYVATEAENLFQYTDQGWRKIEGRGLRIDGNKRGDLWSVTRDGSIFSRKAGETKWTKLEKGRLADIAVSESGQIRGIGIDGEHIFYYDESIANWRKDFGTAHHVEMSKDNEVWMLGMNHKLYWRQSTRWQQNEGGGAGKDLEISDDGTPWVIGTDDGVWRYSRGNDTWARLSGKGHAIAIDGDNNPWVVGMDGSIWKSAGPGI